MRSLFERQRVASESVGTLDVDRGRRRRAPTRTRRCSRCGTACSRTGRASTSRTARAAARPRSPRSSSSSTTRTSLSIPAEIVGPASLGRRRGVKQALEERRQGPVALRHAQRGDKRRLYELAERNARLALEQDKLATQRRRQQRVDALNDLRGALALDALPVRIECFDVSNLGATSHRRLDGRVRGRRAEEVRLPPLQGPGLNGRQDDFAAHGGGPVAAHGAVPAPERALPS